MTLARAFGAMLLAFAIGRADAQPAADDAAVGLWYYHTSFPVGLEGELTVTRRGDRWRAAIGGAEAEGVAADGNVRIDFPNDGAVFRGVIGARGRPERAYWARREMRDDPRYPEGAAQAYAMPLTLRRAGANRWRAQVEPLADPFTLYLNIFRDEAGALKAAIRNPEHNRHGPAMQLDVAREGDNLRFTAPGRDEIVEARLVGERIELRWNGLNRTLGMARATPEQRALFSARPPDAPRYVYREPQDLGDGWRTARARDLGVDEAGLERAVHWITDIDPSSRRAWMIHSIAVAYRGRLILDEYFYGHGPDIPHDMRSASKTFSSVIVGAAMMDGANISPRTPLYELMAPLGPFANPDPRKSRITLAHVMTHTTGLACDDNADDVGLPISPGDEDAMQSQNEQPNWWKFTLDLPMAHEPGERYAYCSGGISLTGGALTMATGEWLPGLFDRAVARPLQFGRYYWNLMPNGEGYVGGGAFVRTRDFLKIGQTYLDNGVWNGRRIVSEEWVRESLLPHVRISPENTGLQGEAFENVYYEVPEGYAWHYIWAPRTGEPRYQAYHGNGNGGQLLIIVPEFDLAVMFTAGNYRTGLWNLERDAIVGEIIIPALNRGPD